MIELAVVQQEVLQPLDYHCLEVVEVRMCYPGREQEDQLADLLGLVEEPQVLVHC